EDVGKILVRDSDSGVDDSDDRPLRAGFQPNTDLSAVGRRSHYIASSPVLEPDDQSHACDPWAQVLRQHIERRRCDVGISYQGCVAVEYIEHIDDAADAYRLSYLELPRCTNIRVPEIWVS